MNKYSFLAARFTSFANSITKKNAKFMKNVATRSLNLT